MENGILIASCQPLGLFHHILAMIFVWEDLQTQKSRGSGAVGDLLSVGGLAPQQIEHGHRDWYLLSSTATDVVAEVDECQSRCTRPSNIESLHPFGASVCPFWWFTHMCTNNCFFMLTGIEAIVCAATSSKVCTIHGQNQAHRMIVWPCV